MKIRKINELDNFIAAIEAAQEPVYLRSQFGDCYNLKSIFSRYIALGALLGEHGEELELFCDLRDDEQLFFKFFKENPDTLRSDFQLNN